MVKLLENTFRAINIGLVNEVAVMCHRLGLDVWEVIDAAATTDHTSIDYARAVAKAQRVYDTRNATREVREGREKIRKL